LGVGGVGFAKARRGLHLPVNPLGAFLIAAAVERRQQVAGDLGRLLEDGVGGIGIDAFGQGRQARPKGRRLEYLVENEAGVAQVGLVAGHGSYLGRRGLLLWLVTQTLQAALQQGFDQTGLLVRRQAL